MTDNKTDIETKTTMNSIRNGALNHKAATKPEGAQARAPDAAAMPRYGFVLAAGLGKRLRPYTDTVPKPMVPLGGRPIIDRVLDKLDAAGIPSVTVNTHYLADKLEAHLAGRTTPALTLSYETALLETGGGLKNALHTVGDEAFFVVSGDSVWEDGPDQPALARMAAAWDDTKMDILILLQPVTRMRTDGVGDYALEADGRAIRALDRRGAYMWTSVRLVHPRVFEGTPAGAFSFLEVLDKVQAAGRLHGLVHDGDWFHVSTPEDLETLNAYLAARDAADKSLAGGA